MKDTGDKTFSVYVHVSPCGKRYVGITSKKPEHRWNNGKAYGQNAYFTRAINKYGWGNFKHIIVCSGVTREEACAKEKELIAEYRANDQRYGYNLSSGGESPAIGSRRTKEFRERMSRARIGRRHTEETKALLSQKKKGMPNGREGKIGKQCGNAGLLYQKEEHSNEIVNVFYGYDEMHRKTGYAKTPVKEAAAGLRKRAYGYLWEYQKRGVKNVFI